jgi:dienelactone hydrolase
MNAFILALQHLSRVSSILKRIALVDTWHVSNRYNCDSCPVFSFPLIELFRVEPRMRPPSIHVLARLVFVIAMVAITAIAEDLLPGRVQAQQLDNTELLVETGDLASELVSASDRFLLRQLAESPKQRESEWTLALTSQKADEFLRSKRDRLRQQLGMVDQRLACERFDVVGSFPLDKNLPVAIASTSDAVAYRVRWPVFTGVDGTGLLITPKDRLNTRFFAIILPDASQTPEQLCGLGKERSEIAFWLAQHGGMILVPHVLRRTEEVRNGRAVLTDQEFIYRSAFVLGRHVLGYQVHETMAAIDIFRQLDPDRPILVAGWGEGGWIALHAAAVDQRIDVTCVSGHFGPRENVWSEPLHRNVQSLLTDFGDAQLAALVAPRPLVIDPNPGPQVQIQGKGAGPGGLLGPSEQAANQELQIAKRMLRSLQRDDRLHLVASTPPSSERIMSPSKAALSKALQQIHIPAVDSNPVVSSMLSENDLEVQDKNSRRASLQKWDRFQQSLLETIAHERKWFWDSFQGATRDNYAEKVAVARERFRTEIIGDWERPLLPARPRSRLIYETPTWTGYEVVLDVFDEVFALGVLLVPKDKQPVRSRPCVVFQHGLEGRPKDTIEGDHPAYHNVSARLAEQGYIVFAPQNLYLFQDRFRSLQRKSNPLGKTLFSIMVPQHRQIVRWLATRPEVDPNKIAFYGLSYGGKSAMRIPALVDEYCMSICSADFNDWVWKNASTTSNYSYVWTGEYEIFEFGLGRTFNYAEMAALIAPRPFMVERGHADGVAPDERVAFEFAKVNRHYTTLLKNPSACALEWFDGPHTIHGEGTFAFLRKHLWSQTE